jgi:hypothetical protein
MLFIIFKQNVFNNVCICLFEIKKINILQCSDVNESKCGRTIEHSTVNKTFLIIRITGNV